LTCCFFSSFKTLLTLTEGIALAPKRLRQLEAKLVPQEDLASWRIANVLYDAGPAQVAKMALRMEELSTEVLARRSLVALVQDESLAIYQQERERVPVEDIVDQLREQSGPGNPRSQSCAVCTCGPPDPSIQAIASGLTI
jgi:hypothetical protein